MSTAYDELIQLRQDGKYSDLPFVMESDYNKTYLNWCKEKNLQPSDETAAKFLEEVENDMFDHQTNIDTNGFFSL